MGLEMQNEIKRGMVCFYGERAINGYLSNWFPAEFTIDGVEFSSVEKYMMYKKAELFNDNDIKFRILDSDSPGVIKKLGRQVKGFKVDTWDKNKKDIVTEGLIEKFRQNEDIKKLLLDTDKAELVECSGTDRIWGIGITKYDDRRFDKDKWMGQNLLGECLMDARRLIKKEHILSKK